MTTYLVTGCGRGIGLAVTKALLARGDRVIGSVRGGRAPVDDHNFRRLTFDVRDDDAVRAAAAKLDEAVDVLINNAGIMGPITDAPLETDPEGFADVLAVNVIGPLLVTRAFLPHLRRSGEAKVAAISSQLGGMSHQGSDRIAYRASKAALNKMMQGIAIDLKKEGIASVVLHPGWVRTDMGGQGAALDPTESAEGIIRVLDSLTLETSGRFISWDGTERPW